MDEPHRGFKMEELKLLCLVAFCFPVVLSQGSSQQGLNAVLRNQPGFPSQIERNFFSPGVGGMRQADQAKEGVFTVDKHLEVPSTTVARGSSRFGMEGSRQGRVETTRFDLLNAPGAEGGTPGAADQRQSGGRFQGQMETNRQAQFDTSGQVDVTVERDAFLPTRMPTGEQQRGFAGTGAMGFDSSRQGQFSEAQAATVGTMDRRMLQGQLEASNRAQMTLGGQGDVQSGMGVDTQVAGSQSGELSGSQANEIAASRAVDVSDSRVGEIGGSMKGRISEPRAAEISGSQTGDISATQTGEIRGSRLGDVSGSQTGELSRSLMGEISGSQTGKMIASRRGEISTSQTGQVGGSKIGEMSGSRTGQLTGSSVGEISASRAGEMSSSRTGEMSGSQTGQFSGSRTGQIGGTRTGEINTSRGGQIGDSRNFQLGSSQEGLEGARGGQLPRQFAGQTGTTNDVTDRRGFGGFNGGSISTSNQVDLQAGGQGQITVEGQVAVPRQTFDSVPRTQDMQSSQSFDVAGQRRVDAMTGGRVDFGTQEQGRSLGGRTLDFSGVDVSEPGQSQLGSLLDQRQSFSRERDFQAARSRETALGLSKDASITGPRGGQLDVSRKAELGLTRDSQIGLERERGLNAGQTTTGSQFGTIGDGRLSASQETELSGGRSRDATLGLSRDVTLTGPQGGKMEVSRNAELGLSRNAQVRMGRERGLAADRTVAGGVQEGQLSGSSQTDFDASGQGEIAIEGQIEVPRQMLNSIGQSAVGMLDLSGQIGSQAELSGQGSSVGGMSIDLRGQGQFEQGIDASGKGTVGQSEQKRTFKTDKFPGTGRLSGFGTGQRIGEGSMFEFSRISVNVRCYADPMKGLSCGVEYPDDQCKEKWDFPNPCTRENMEVNITKFVHPYDNSKFLMCGEMGKLYIVQCPRLEIFHAGCGQCVDENVGLTASCEEPLPPQTSNPCTRQNIIDNKLFFGFPGNLSKFIHCDVWGKPWVRECTRGEVWNQWAVACVQPALVNPCSRLNADLAYLYPHPCDPKKFIRCDQQGVAYEDACGWNEAFNEATQYCDPIGSFYGSDRQEFCEGFMFGFKQYRDQGVIDPGFIQGRGQLGSPNNTPGQGGVDVGTGGGWQANIRNRGPDRTDTGLGVNGKPISPTEGVTNLAGTITIHRSKLRTYVYKKNEQYAQPCVIENIKEGRYHFRVTGDPHSFIQCDDHGFSHKITCPGPKIGPKDYFDPWTNTCVDGPIHEDYRFSR